MSPRQALIAATDAKLRVGAFDLLASYGFRVDATGDAQALDRRLAKDRYDWLITDATDLPPLPDETEVIQIATDSLKDREAWSEQIELRLTDAGIERPPPPEKS